MIARIATLALSLITCGCSVSHRIADEASVEAWFIHRSPAYYSNLAHACDEVLLTHPVANGAFYFPPIPDSTLPKLITDLHPRELVLTSTSVSLGYRPLHGNEGFWIGWGPGDADTNTWTLEANLTEGRKSFYAELRKAGS
jgi:hypothetical protein